MNVNAELYVLDGICLQRINSIQSNGLSGIFYPPL